MKFHSAQARLRSLQRRIYLALEREARCIFGETPSAIRRYERECERDFKGRFQISNKNELIQAVRKSDVSFIADYHTFAQAQRTALRLLREAVLPGEKWALGLELIPSQYQSTLDLFQNGKLSVARFHKLIDYEEQWGFPWKNYEPLFDWAREHQVRLIALNRPKELIYRSFNTQPDGSCKDLHARDQWASGIITDLFYEDRDMRMIVLYGGLHIGRAHLPEQLKKISKTFFKAPLRSLSIHQNHKGLYWKLAEQERELHTQVIRLKQDAFCVFSGTPWAQLQSLISSAEGEDLETPETSQDEMDYLSLMRSYGEVIAEFFGLKKGSYESLSLRTIDDADFVESLDELFTPSERKLIQRQVRDNHRMYLPRTHIAYLASPSMNAVSELAAIHLLRQHTRINTFFEGGREDFFRQVLEAGFGFLGSLILNPRRKCDLPADHARRIRALSRGEKAAFSQEITARRIALDIMKGPSRKAERTLDSLPLKAGIDASAVMAAAHYVGQNLAKRLHPIVLQEKHGAAGFQETVALFLRRRRFEEAYLELLGLVSGPSRKEPSKTDHL